MSAPRINRGPMAAEVLERDYTRVSNELLRDARISYKAKGIFCWLASHREGFGVSPESIAAAGAEGISAVKSALRELEEYGYLVRSQVRTGAGTMGDFTYRITDMPSSVPVDGNRPPVSTSKDAQNRRSEPVDGKPPADEPPAADRPHKKTIPLKKISSEEKTTSSSLLQESEGSVVADATEGGGGGESPSKEIAVHIAAHLDYRGKPPDKRQQQTLTDRLIAALDSGWSVDGLAYYLDLGSAQVDSPAAVYAHRLRPDILPDAEPLTAPAAGLSGVRGPLLTAADYEALTVDSVFGPARRDTADGGLWERAMARAQARGGSAGGSTRTAVQEPYKPYSNDAWYTAADPVEAAKIPHCGHWDCDSYTRLRGGQVCPDCHPKGRL